MAALPYMPLYVADYLADAAHLNTLEHGAYLLLIMNYWQRGKPLPNDDERLSNICRTSVEQWRSIRSTVLEFFREKDGVLTHDRIEKELSKVRATSKVRAKAGKISAQKRVSKQEDSNTCSAPAEHVSNYTDTDTDTDTKKERKNGQVPNGEPDFFDEVWKIYPHPPNRGEKPRTKFAKLAEAERKSFMEAIPIMRKKLEADRARGFDRQAPMFATYLNQRRWETEAESAPAKRDNSALLRLCE